MKKLLKTQNLLWLALFLALIGSLRHVAWGFSTLEQGDLLWGYVQAIAVDVGLFALAIGIQQRRKQERGTAGLWAGVILFSAISTYANLLHGLVFSLPVDISGWGDLGLWMIIIKPFVLSAVLPTLVVYMSEIVAANVEYDDFEAKRQALPEHIQARAIIESLWERYGREPTVVDLVGEYGRLVGDELLSEAADRYILEWRADTGKVGARPRLPMTVNGKGASDAAD